MLQRAEDRTPAEEAALVQLKQRAPEIERAVTLGERFPALLRQRQGDLAYDQWVVDADVGGVAAGGGGAPGEAALRSVGGRR